MNKNYIKELLWLVVVILIIFILNLVAFGFDVFKSEIQIDFNFYDTYFVVERNKLLFYTITLVVFTVFFWRTFIQKFRIFPSNLILICALVLLIMLTNSVVAFMDNLVGQDAGWIIYPPLSVEPVEIEPVENNLALLSNIIWLIQLGLVAFLSFVSFKTGANYQIVQKIYSK
uniref:hypothetical protein n=1 Tax=Flavobacterium sp. TaxID=239 RepID=UPI00404B45F1